MSTKKKVKPKAKRIKLLKNKLWPLLSEYSRRKDAIGEYGNCCCCGKLINWKYEGDAGHFVPKSRGQFWYWEINNIHLQCKTCNCPRSSALHDVAQAQYTLYMQNRYGQEYVDYLLSQDGKLTKYTEAYFEEMIIKVTQLLEELNHG